MLVSLKEANMTQSMGDLFKTPVAGAVTNDRVPTSGDVHLYLDPETAFEDFPILYADCEGLEGGETRPQAKLFSNLRGKQPADLPEFHNQREIILPPTNKVKLGTREHAVRNVYPRLLYTFSDVIVFVMKNARYALAPCCVSIFMLAELSNLRH
jgi:hypothetical protein